MPVTQLHAPSDKSGHHILAPVASLDCRSAPELVRHIRNFVCECALRLDASDETAQTAKLLASELVSNAVRHTPPGTPVRVEVLHDTDCGLLIVAVEDFCTQLPTLPGERRPAHGDESGWGLPLVSGLAEECGIVPIPHGKRIWFALNLFA